MSLVIAIKDGNRFVLGADKQVSTGGNKEHTCTKIWEVRDLPGAIMGGVGTARASQIIQYTPIVDRNAFDLNQGPTTEFVITALAPTIAACLKGNGIPVDIKDEDGVMMPNAFIFAYRDRAWMIYHDLSVMEIEDYFAIGSGADVARGALFVTTDKNPFERIARSIEAAAETTLFVDDGIDLLVTGRKKNDAKQICKALGLDFDAIKAEFESGCGCTEEEPCECGEEVCMPAIAQEVFEESEPKKKKTRKTKKDNAE